MAKKTNENENGKNRNKTGKKVIEKPVQKPQQDITSKVIDFYDVVASVQDHRYKSWEHCYDHFNMISTAGKQFNDLNPMEKELAQLNLSFYLASWGMYRGSTFALQKDYTIFKGIAEEVLKPDYNLLWDIKENAENSKELNTQFKNLYENISSHLLEVKKTIQDHKDLTPKKREFFKKEKVTDTLITKVILGTIGCIPAYDRYFKDGLGIKGFQKKFNQEKSLIQLLEFYNVNKGEIDNLAQEINYTPMKIIDMYFWKVGYDADESEDKEA